MRTRKEIDKLYLIKFIESMEKDFDKWERTTSYSWEYSYDRYLSPKYGDVTFGFDNCFLSYEGAWIGGIFKWQIPNNVLLNPFNPYFWKYRNAKKKLKSYYSNKLINEKIENLIDAFNESEKIIQSSQIREGKLKGNQKHPKSNRTTSLPSPPLLRSIKEGKEPRRNNRDT